jgi:hypothetical protein
MPKQSGKEKSLKAPRHHHYIPEFYLKGFTSSGSKDDYLWVLDLEEKKLWKAKPENVAHQRDFYRAELPDVDPDTLEKALGKIESEAATVVKTIIDKRTLPEGEDFIILINLVALMAARVPRFRSIFSEPLEKIHKFMLKMVVATPERWKATIERMKRDGRMSEDEETSYENMKRFVESDNYEIVIDQNWHLKTLIDSVDIIIPLLLERKWSLIIVEDEANEFICSDSPVALSWTKPMPAFSGPGFGMENTELTMPLNKHIALVARFEGEPQDLMAPKETIAKLNSRTGMHAQRFIYSGRQDFIWFKKNGEFGNITDLMSSIKTKNQKEQR